MYKYILYNQCPNGLLKIQIFVPKRIMIFSGKNIVRYPNNIRPNGALVVSRVANNAIIIGNNVWEFSNRHNLTIIISYHMIFSLFFCAAAPLTNNRDVRAPWSRDAQFGHLWCRQSFDIQTIIIYSIKIIIVYTTYVYPPPFLFQYVTILLNAFSSLYKYLQSTHV